MMNSWAHILRCSIMMMMPNMTTIVCCFVRPFLCVTFTNTKESCLKIFDQSTAIQRDSCLHNHQTEIPIFLLHNITFCTTVTNKILWNIQKYCQCVHFSLWSHRTPPERTIINMTILDERKWGQLQISFKAIFYFIFKL